jgi:AGZA family xanthine/uracil permease-like MFS transporter
VLGLTGHGLGLLEILFVFLFVDLFDNIGTLVAVTKRAGLMTPDGRIPKLNRILFADAIATIVGLDRRHQHRHLLCRKRGRRAGGRAHRPHRGRHRHPVPADDVRRPYAQLVPLAATAPALILVGG